MTIPCESKPEIQQMKQTIASMGNSGNKLEIALLKMVSAHEKQTTELREMTQTITNHMVDNREFRINLERAKEERDLLFGKVRSVNDTINYISKTVHDQELKIQRTASSVDNINKDLKPIVTAIPKLKTSQDRITGGMILVPGFFTFLSLCVAVYVAAGGGK